MKNIIFLFIVVFIRMYVDADVYTITTSDLKPQNERVLSVSSQYSLDGPEVNISCPNDYVIVRKQIADQPLYDGVGIYVDTKVRKAVQMCNNDITELSGTILSILLNALGFDNDEEIACPIEQGVTCLQKEFKMVSGNFEGVFENDTTDATLEIHLPALVRAKFSISRQKGLPVPENVTDSSANEQYEIQQEIDEGKESSDNPANAA